MEWAVSLILELAGEGGGLAGGDGAAGEVGDAAGDRDAAQGSDVVDATDAADAAETFSAAMTTPRKRFAIKTDGRIIFAIPYETDFTLIGTTSHRSAIEPQVS